MNIDLNGLLNHVRLKELLARGQRRLQEIFRQRWKNYKGADWKNGDGKELLPLCVTAMKGVKDALTDESIDKWDITAASFAIKVVSIEIQKNGATANSKEDKNIALLRNFRNDFSHGKSNYSNDEFNKKWNELAAYLVSLGDNHADIKKLKVDLMELGKQKVEGAVDMVDANNETCKKSDESDSLEAVAQNVEENDQRRTDIKSETSISKNDERIESVSSKVRIEKSEAVQFLEKGDKLLKANEYKNAIEAYSESLQFPGLSTEEKAHVFANRSAAYLMFNTKESCQLAKKDAEWTIQFWPSWWKGHYQLGKANCKLEEVHEAEKALNNAYALNPGSKDVRDELNVVKHKIGVISRADHLKPENQLPPDIDRVEELQTNLGISKKQAKKIANKAINLQNNDFVKAMYYHHGKGGFQKNYTKAANFYERAAINGHTESMFNLASLYQEGNGVKQDFDKSMEWLMKAATTDPNGRDGRGIAEAQHAVAMNYRLGIGVTKDYKKAIEWCEKSMLNGCNAAASSLGMMYKHGNGVPRNSKKAFELFKIAAKNGDTQAMVNLGICYLNGEGTDSGTTTDENIAEGKKWYKTAADKGNLQAVQNLKIVENYTKEDANIHAFKKFMDAKDVNTNNPLNRLENKKDVKESARKGSITAQRLVDIWKNLDVATEAFKSNDSDKLVAALSKAIQNGPYIVEIPELFNDVIKSKFKKSPNDLNTIICYVHFDRRRPELPKIIEKYLTMFPENEYLLEMRITCFIAKSMIKEALVFTNSALELHPKSVLFMYNRAMILSILNDPEALIAEEKFLASVPEDNDKVPGCHYRMAMCYYMIGNTSKFMQSYEAAISAEAKQLPCFLPYDCPKKYLLDPLYEQLKKQRESKKHGSTGKTPFTHKLEEIKENVERKLLFNQHRQMISQHKLLNPISRFVKPLQTANAPSFLSLKKITLKDMKEEKLYNGYVLEAKIIDWPMFVNGILSIIEDENGDLQRLCVDNWPKKANQTMDIVEALKSFRPNTLVSIINPHLRPSFEHTNSIHVDHPAQIQINNCMAVNKCCCCGKEGKSMPTCSKCLMSRYCSTECQRFDWKELCHSKVCEELKKYSKYMGL